MEMNFDKVNFLCGLDINYEFKVYAIFNLKQVPNIMWT